MYSSNLKNYIDIEISLSRDVKIRSKYLIKISTRSQTVFT